MKRAGIFSGIVLGLVSMVLFAGTGLAMATRAARPAGPTSARSMTTAGTAQVAGGATSGYAIGRDGSLWSWGANGMGELGLGNTDGLGVTHSRLLPHRVGHGTSWKALAAGEQFCLALKKDGSLWSWGGQALGLPVPPYDYPRPRRVGSALWRIIGAGDGFGAGIQRDGSLWTWGHNALGQLGLGTTDPGWLPAQVGADHDWKTMAVGYDCVLAIKTDGSLWSWGANYSGQLGNGTSDPAPGGDRPGVPHPTPARVGGDNDWSSVAAGLTSAIALKNDGSLWAWGGIGNGHHLVPTRVRAATDWEAIAAGGQALALKRDGTLWAWGLTSNGYSGGPTRVGRNSRWAQISAGGAFDLAIKRDGSAWAWGNNFCGQLGLGDRRTRSTPSRIVRLK
jgi:alpha-tubulin suppressor-like RCC1 family protein